MNAIIVQNVFLTIVLVLSVAVWFSDKLHNAALRGSSGASMAYATAFIAAIPCLMVVLANLYKAPLTASFGCAMGFVALACVWLVLHKQPMVTGYKKA